jgi:prepilin-type N-terminal cleavage/methylation domain-containing protein
MTKLFHQSQNGFTLIELLIGIALSAILLIGLTITVIQLIQIPPVTSNNIAVIRNLDTAGSWFIRDFQSTSTTDLPASVTLIPTGNGSPSLNITQFLENGSASGSQITYTIDLNNSLIRHNITDGTSVIIANDITRVQYTTGTNSITITATIDTTTKTRSYQISSRVTN